MFLIFGSSILITVIVVFVSFMIMGILKVSTYDNKIHGIIESVIMILLMFKNVILGLYFGNQEQEGMVMFLILYYFIEIFLSFVFSKPMEKYFKKLYNEKLVGMFLGKDEVIFNNYKRSYKKYLDSWGAYSYDIAEEYDDIQALIRRYAKISQLSSFEYNQFIMRVFYGYNHCEIGVSKGSKDTFLRTCAGVSFEKLNNCNKEREVVAMKHKVAFETIQSLIGLELSEEVQKKVEKVFYNYASELKEGVSDIQKAKQLVHETEQRVNQKQQERLSDLMDSVLELQDRE